MGATFHAIVVAWCVCGLSWCGIGLAQSASGSIAARAQEAGCSNKPTVVEGTMYKCITSSGNAAYFNVPGVDGGSPPRTPSRATPTPAGFPKVDADTQRGRDGVRRKVLSDELDTEEKLLAEARAAYGDGAPAPLAEEQKDAQKYASRLAKLRQAVSLHEKNIEALRKELAALK
jgi:hypothetical protein